MGGTNGVNADGRSVKVAAVDLTFQITPTTIEVATPSQPQFKQVGRTLPQVTAENIAQGRPVVPGVFKSHDALQMVKAARVEGSTPKVTAECAARVAVGQYLGKSNPEIANIRVSLEDGKVVVTGGGDQGLADYVEKYLDGMQKAGALIMP
jgi:hypothetical protein